MTIGECKTIDFRMDFTTVSLCAETSLNAATNIEVQSNWYGIIPLVNKNTEGIHKTTKTIYLCRMRCLIYDNYTRISK